MNILLIIRAINSSMYDSLKDTYYITLFEISKSNHVCKFCPSLKRKHSSEWHDRPESSHVPLRFMF